MRLAPNAVSVSHQLAKMFVSHGDVVVDATAGNGHDTIFLAQLVGSTGQVFSFDIQQEAIFTTQKRITLAKLASRVNIVHDGHENLDKYIKRPIKLVVFNLGYLPGGDKKVITRPETTIEAIKKSLNLLEPYGVILLTIYTGHPGGQDEWESIETYLSSLPKEYYDVILYKYLNRNLDHPFTIMVQKLNNA